MTDVTGWRTSARRLGVAGVVFFVLKGLAWLVIAVAAGTPLLGELP